MHACMYVCVYIYIYCVCSYFYSFHTVIKGTLREKQNRRDERREEERGERRESIGTVVFMGFHCTRFYGRLQLTACTSHRSGCINVARCLLLPAWFYSVLQLPACTALEWLRQRCSCCICIGSSTLFRNSVLVVRIGVAASR